MYRNVFLGAILLSMPLVVWSQQDTIADQRLEEIMVTAKLPLVEISAGKTSYRMDASVTQSTGSLYDVLASLPGVVIDSNGNILLNGQSGATILMDGKPTYLSGDELMSLLKSTPATNADKIDLITQPSARHDAAGSSGLIDIRTRKIRLRGVNLALNGNGSLGRTGGGYGGVSMNVRENKFNLYLNYSYYQGKDVIDLFIDRAFERDGGRMMQNSYRKRRNYSHYFRTGCDYYLNERTVWGVSLGGNFSRQRENAGMFTEIRETGVAGNTYSHAEQNRNNVSAGTSMVHKLKREGGELSASFDYFHYYRVGNQLMDSFKPDTLKGDMKGNTDLYVGQIDAVYPLSEVWKLQAGRLYASVGFRLAAGRGAWFPICI